MHNFSADIDVDGVVFIGSNFISIDRQASINTITGSGSNSGRAPISQVPSAEPIHSHERRSISVRTIGNANLR